MSGFWNSLFGGKQKEFVSARPYKKGDRIGRQYEVCKILGEGKNGMGNVYYCIYFYGQGERYASPVVLKTFQDKYLLSKEAQEQFKREAFIWIILKHPYIVNVYTVNRLDGRLFIELDYYAPDDKGRSTLSHYLGNLSFQDILKYSIQFCYGMEYAHSQDVIHRDIKPDNILISCIGKVAITDFGLSRASEEAHIARDEITSHEGKMGLSLFHTRGKAICGTPPHMAPEQFSGHTDKRSDIYSFGIVLYQMVTNGSLPFNGRSFQEYEELHKYAKVPHISSPLKQVIQKCLEKDPSKRFQDFHILREQLEEFFLKEGGEKIVPPEVKLNYSQWRHKGFGYYNLRRYREAIICCDEAVKLNPQYAPAWVTKALSQERLGLRQDAVNSYRHFITYALAPGVDMITKGMIMEGEIKIARQRLRELER